MNLNIKEEDIKFLNELSHKLNTQETDGCCKPVFWMIQEETKVYDSQSGEYFTIFNDGELIFDSKIDDLEEFKKEFIQDLYKKHYDDFNEIENLEELREFIEYSFPDYDYINDITIRYYDTEYQISNYSGAFLTKEAAKKHLEENSYHYRNGRTWGMVATRNPELERLLEIITNMTGNLD